MDAQVLADFRQLIAGKTGLNLREPEINKLAEYIHTRLQFYRYEQAQQYYQILENRPLQDPEWEALIDLLTIGESYFFRDQEQFALIKTELLPRILARPKQQKTLRIWSAGCASGEEPYSLAIIVHELLANTRGWNVFILGTDIAPRAIAKARIGLYGDWSFRMVDPAIQEKYFHHQNAVWKIRDHLRAMVQFQCGNLLQDPFPYPPTGLYDIDLIVCRNVFIYFEDQAITTILQKFFDTIGDQGYLVTGHAELTGKNLCGFHSKMFPGSVVYQKQERILKRPEVSVPRIERSTSLPLDATRRKMQLTNEQLQTLSSLHKQAITDILNKTTRAEAKITKSLPLQKTATRTVAKATGQQQQEQPNQGQPNQGQLAAMRQDLQGGHYQRVIAQGQRLLLQTPNHEELLQLLAQAHADLGQHEEAKRLGEQAISANPLHTAAYCLMARISEEENDWDTAKAYWKKVMYIAPDYVPAYLELSALYAKQDDVVRSQKMRASAMELLQKLPPDTWVDACGGMSAWQLLAFLKE